MSVTVIGNHGRGFVGRGITGVGGQNLPVGVGWCAVIGSQAGDKEVVQLSSILNGNLQQGIFFQSEAGATIEFTLCNPGMADSTDPAEAAATLWANSLAVPASTIVKAPVLFTACRITFNAPGAVYIGAR